MKKIIYTLLAVCMFSCGSPVSKYEKIIADAVQTDSRGTYLELNFKAIEITEVGQVTAKDSIDVLTAEFRNLKQVDVEKFEQLKGRVEHQIKNENNRPTPNQNTIDKYKTDIAKIDQRIDSLKNIVPDNLAGYDKMNADEVLAIIVRCKYEIDTPVTKKRAQETFDFYLSPDGTKYYTKRRAK